MTPELLAELRTAAGSALLERAAALAGLDPVTAGQVLRDAGVAPPLAAAALTQAELRVRAAAKLGPQAARMFFTRAGLEQATRLEVARRRAGRLVAAGVTRMADLGCGIGGDTVALAAAGIQVYAVDADPLAAAVAAANVAALDQAGRVTVSCGAAQDMDLSAVNAVFCDPARRRGTKRVFDPAAYSPPWNFVAALPERVPRTVLKLAPGIDHARLPRDAEGEWVSVDGDVVEAAFWCGPLAAAPRRATVLRHGLATELTGDGRTRGRVGGIRRYLYDPDGAVVRAHLVAELAATLRGNLGDPHIAYVYSDSLTSTPLARAYEIVEALPFSVKRLRALLRDRRVGRLTVKKRGSAVAPEQLRHALRLAGDEEATVVLTRVAGAATAFLCQPR